MADDGQLVQALRSLGKLHGPQTVADQAARLAGRFPTIGPALRTLPVVPPSTIVSGTYYFHEDGSVVHRAYEPHLPGDVGVVSQYGDEDRRRRTRHVHYRPWPPSKLRAHLLDRHELTAEQVPAEHDLGRLLELHQSEHAGPPLAEHVDQHGTVRDALRPDGETVLVEAHTSVEVSLDAAGELEYRYDGQPAEPTDVDRKLDETMRRLVHDLPPVSLPPATPEPDPKPAPRGREPIRCERDGCGVLVPAGLWSGHVTGHELADARDQAKGRGR